MKKILVALLLLATTAFAGQPVGIVKGINGQWPIVLCYAADGITLVNCTDHWLMGSGTQDPASGYGSNGDLFWRSDLLSFRTKTAGVWGALTFGSTSFPLLAPNGSVSAISYSFASAPSAGLWLDLGFYATLKSVDGSGVDQNGGATQIYPGKGTGTGSGGTVYIAACLPSVASGSTLNTCQNVALFQGVGNILLGNAQVATGVPALSQFYGANAAAGRTDVVGAGIAFRGGQGTGSAAGGGFSFGVAPPTVGTGSTQNGIQNALVMSGADASVNIGGVQALNPGQSNWTGASATASNVVGGVVAITGGAATNGNAAGGDVLMDGGAGVGTGIKGFVRLVARTFATLGTPSNGSLAYCSDCTIANPCAGAGTGALAKRINAVWVCN
jgi:hypothetical protein